MPTKPPYARIAITLPVDDLAAADRVARERDRSRSWVIAEAIRQYVASSPPANPQAQQRAEGIGDSRPPQLLPDLQLPPEQRVQAAEDTARVSFLRRRQRPKQVVAFDRYED